MSVRKEWRMSLGAAPLLGEKSKSADEDLPKRYDTLLKD